MITREQISVGMSQHPAGGVCHYTNFAAYDWQPGSVAPVRPDSLEEKRWRILAQYSHGVYLIWYWNGMFRDGKGATWGTPQRWAYLRLEEEIWNPDKQQWEIPGLTYTAPPAVAPTGKAGVHMDAVQGQWMVDDLKRSFTTAQIMDMLDSSPYDEPDTGAPEPSAGGTE